MTVIIDRREGPDRRKGRPRETGGKRVTRDRRRPRIPGTFLEAEGERKPPTRIATMAILGREDLPELHRRRVGRRRLRRDLREHEPGERRRRSGPSRARAPRTSSARSPPPRRPYEDWRLVPAPKRGEILFRFAHLLAEEKEDLAQLMAREMGKVLPEARRRRPGSDRHGLLHGRRGPAPVRADDALRAARQVQHEHPPADRRRRRDHALELPDRDPDAGRRCPRSSAGNTVVFKPATDTPTLGERFVELLVEAGVPAGVVNIVHGGGGEVGERARPAPRRPGRSRSPARARPASRSRKTGADRLKHIHLELGGKNAIIVLDDADLDLAVEGIIWSAFGTSGQRCTAASRVIAHEAVYDAARLQARAPRPRSCASATAGKTTRTSARSSTRRRSRRSTRTRRSARTRARRSSPAARSPPATASTRASTTGRRSSATSTRRCGSPRRRSSARRPR